MSDTYTYANDAGDTVEATPHEYVSHYKNLGYLLVAEDEAEKQPVEVAQSTPEVQHQLEGQDASEEAAPRPKVAKSVIGNVRAQTLASTDTPKGGVRTPQ